MNATDERQSQAVLAKKVKKNEIGDWKTFADFELNT